MATRSLYLILIFSLISRIFALQVTPNSPCSSKCIDSSALDESDPNSSNTVTEDIVCEDADLTSTATGTKWKQCMSCLQNSTYTQGEESDQQWFLYNLRYSFDYCVYGYPNGSSTGSNPCETSTACGTLKTAMEYGNLSLESSEFGYCDANGGSLAGRYYDACFNCVSAGGDTNYIANALVALEAGCLQRPNTTDLLGLSNSVFSSSVITIVDPSTIKKSTQSSIHLSIAVIAGIAAGSAGLIAIITAIVFVWCRRRRNRANLGMTPRWGRNNNRHKRQSSFSFRCRNILSSPISPKFFQDLSPMDEHQTYGSLDEQMSGIANGGGGGGRGRYYIESKQKMARHPYETSLDGWGIQEGASPPQAHPDGIIIDQWNTFSFPEKKLNRSKKGGMTIDTTKSMLSAPPAAHKSPKANQFDISPSRVQQQYPPQQQYNTQQFPYAPTDLIVTTTSPQSQTSSHITIKPRTTTMSSQGSGYPKLKSPTTSSPLLRSGGRGEAEPWFPPPPPGPPPSSSPSSRYGRKASGSSIGKARGKRESGSPVESKQIKVSFPGPPMR